MFKKRLLRVYAVKSYEVNLAEVTYLDSSSSWQMLLLLERICWWREG